MFTCSHLLKKYLMEKFFLCSARTLILTKPSMILAEKIEKLFFMYFSESIKIQNLCFNLNLVAHSSIMVTFIDGYVTLNNFTIITFISVHFGPSIQALRLGFIIIAGAHLRKVFRMCRTLVFCKKGKIVPSPCEIR